MKRFFLALCVAAAAAACGETSPMSMAGTAPSAVVPPSAGMSGGKVRKSSETACLGTTYVGPIRLPISVHETTATLSWLGADDGVGYDASRGYGLEFERYDVTNVWLFAKRDVVTSPEVQEFLTTEGRYRVRVRGLFCDNQNGPWTEWVVFSTDDSETHQPPNPVVVIVPPVVPPVDPPVVISPPVGCLACPPPVVPPVVVPPVDPPSPPAPPVVCPNGDHNNDGHCDSGNPPTDSGNGNGNGGGNGGGNGNPPPGTGNGSDCSMHTSAKPVTPPGQGNGGGNGNGNPPDADHNNDGHNDCGVGNQH